MRFLYFFLLCSLVFACTNEDKELTILQQPPFATLSDSIKQFPGNAGLYYNRGVMLYQKNEKVLATADIRKAWMLQPTEEYGLSLTTLLKEKNVDSAVLFLEEATRKIPESIALQIGLARGYQQKGENEKAQAITQMIVKQFPGQLDALALQSEILKEGHPEESLAYLEKAHHLVPSDPSLAYDLAFAYAEAKNAKAITLTDSLIQAKAPEVEKAFYTKALFFEATGKNAEALSNYDKAIQANYTFLDSYLDKGKLLYRQKNYADALKVLQKGLQIRSTEPQFYFWAGKVQEAMGNKTEAKLNYQRAYGLDKSLKEAKEAAYKIKE